MSNNISFVGRIGQEPVLKEVGDSHVLEFSIANNTGFGDKKVTSWFRCALWGKQGKALEQHLSKGKQIFVTGELTLREYEKDGAKRISPDIRVNAVDFVSGGSEGGGSPTAGQQTQSEADLPF
jgi:single-strand DNA-binding protein